MVFLDLLLDGSGRPLPERATVKSPTAISRFLNHASWDTRRLSRMLRCHALEALQSLCQQHPGHQPRLEVLIDLTSLEKTGKFATLTGWVHTYNGVYGVHLVVLYLCCAPLRFPWAFQIWRGKGTPSPAQLALKLLRTVPAGLLKAKRTPRLHADGGFKSADFIQGVLAKGLDIVVGVRCTRKLEDGRSVQEVLTRGEMVKPTGLHQPMCLSWVWLYRNEEPEQRFVMSNLDLGGKYLARVGKRRWRIECTFGSYKSRGFDLERTGITDPQRLERLFGLVTLAWLNCLRIGIWKHAVKPIRVLAHGRKAMSLVRYGSEHLRSALRWDPGRLGELFAFMILPFSAQERLDPKLSATEV